MIRRCSRSLLASAPALSSASSLFLASRLAFPASAHPQRPSPRKPHHDVSDKNQESPSPASNSPLPDAPNAHAVWRETESAVWSEPRLQRFGGFGNEHKAGFLGAITLLFLLNVVTRLSL